MSLYALQRFFFSYVFMAHSHSNPVIAETVARKTGTDKWKGVPEEGGIASVKHAQMRE